MSPAFPGKRWIFDFVIAVTRQKTGSTGLRSTNKNGTSSKPKNILLQFLKATITKATMSIEAFSAP